LASHILNLRTLSSPTRRSSDLKMELGGASPVALSDQLLVSKRVYSPDGTCILAALMDPKTGTVKGSLVPASGGAPRYSRSGNKRSEEHTSELQSHLNLVCRLLL